MKRERNESGEYVEQVTPDAVLDVFETADLPVLTATEVSEELDCSRASAYNKLEQLVAQGEIQKKKVGARAVVYIFMNDD
ncbi:helix-turn-helix domain-containing protein [Halorussus amylolyticus]|uniref:helix-turn-helix domain-containing protein n=1 Tax=Halorussus amylolyticus TaxID=1126242 RepID=UPI0010482505|nr:helix-turn-helix domain-containing protein [Halorussus amylolyticus]